MKIKRMNAEAKAWREENKRIREWLLCHPRCIQEGMWHVSINMTEVLEAELDREMKNVRRPGRTSFRNRAKDFLLSIIPHFDTQMKEVNRFMLSSRRRKSRVALTVSALILAILLSKQ